MLTVDDIKRLITLAKSRRRITEVSNSTNSEVSNSTNSKGNICDYIILTMILTGMRIGECLALKWHNLHFDTSTIDVHHEYDPDSHHLGPVKTPSSYRTITVNRQLIDILKVIILIMFFARQVANYRLLVKLLVMN